jgi:hypothetical protein
VHNKYWSKRLKGKDHLKGLGLSIKYYNNIEMGLKEQGRRA